MFSGYIHVEREKEEEERKKRGGGGRKWRGGVFEHISLNIF